MCVFCDIVDGKIPSKKVYENDEVLAILDLSQVTYGHTIVMPKTHCANILEASEETASACIKGAKHVAELLMKNTDAKGINILNNCGEAAGQTVEHLHFHVIPRYDENDAISIAFNPSKEQDLDEVLKKVSA